MVVKTGTAGNDVLVGTSDGDTLRGLGGNDHLTGLAGADVLDGAAGIDTVHYNGSTGAISVNLLFNSASGGDAAGDTFREIENVSGSSFVDQIIGDGGSNMLQGNGGDDSLFGLAGDDILAGGAGADRLEGDNGIDIADYSGSGQGVSVDLLLNTASGGDAQGDTFDTIESLNGSKFVDQLRGDDKANDLLGGFGNDTLKGNGGDDVLVGADGIDKLEGGLGADKFRYLSTADSGIELTARDVIADFQPGADKVDLHLVDAKAAIAGDQSSVYIGGNNFTAEGQVRAFTEGSHTVLEVNNAGPIGTDMQIELTGNFNLTAGDFLL